MATITIADNDARVQYTQAVTANVTQLTIDFPFFDLDDINVIVTSAAGVDTTLSRGTGTGTFAVTGTSVDDGYSGGYITLGDSYADASTKYTIFRDIPVARTTDFPTSGPFNISSLNTELDKIFAVEQELETKITRTLQLSDSDSTVDLKLPNLDTRKGTVLAFNATTGVPEAGPTISDVSTVAAITADIATLADIEDGTDATDAIQTVAGISSNVTTVAGISSNVTTVAGISADVTSVAADATDIGTVSTNIASVNTVAGISSNVTTTAGIAANITTTAGIASDITAVAADATDIGTVATNISNVNTVAGQTTNLQNVTDNLTAIQNASSNATSAASSATAAAASAASAATAYDSFDDRYLGVKASDPTLDNDGNALVSGALYFSSSQNIMKVYDGASWIAATSAGNVSLILYEYTATSGQTTFSGADDNAATLSYTVNNIQVVMNGVILDPSDYTATNGTSVVLASGAAAGDLINIYAFKSFTVADTVSASAGGTFSANVAINGDLTVDTSTLYVDSTNNRVGIATSSPGNELHVYKSSAGTAGRLQSGGTNVSLQLSNSTDADGYLQYNGANMAFFTAGSERMRIDSSGNVGIGTSSPSTSLHVKGSSASGVVRAEHNSSSVYAEITGSSSNAYLATGNNPLVFEVNSAERMRLLSGGDLHLGGTGQSDGKLTITGKSSGGSWGTKYITDVTSGSYYFINFCKNDGSASQVGSITSNGSSTSYNTSSDYRLKENVTEVTGAADRVKALNPVRFNFIADPDTTVDGFLAHEVQDVVPEAISGTKDAMRDEEYEVTPAVLDEDGNEVTPAVMGTRTVPDYQGIDQSKLVPLLTAALQEALTKIDDLESRLAVLETA